MNDDAPRLRHFLPALALALFSASSIFAVTLASPPQGGQMAVIAPPWFDLGETAAIVVNAGGRMVEVGGFGNVLVAYSEDPGFSAALYRAGAWLVVDPARLRGCLGLNDAPAAMEGRV